MALDLNILPLDTVETFSYQKCLIPSDRFPPNTRPAQWVKCYFENEINNRKVENYAVAQIFPRDDMDQVSYLDTSIIRYEVNGMDNITLKSIQLLQEKFEVEELDVVIHLNSQYFINNSTSMTKAGLKDVIHIMLQKYHITNKCSIRDSIFRSYGVNSLYVKVAKDMDENVCYTVTDNTLVNIKSVRLANDLNSNELLCLNVFPLNRARKDLDNVMKMIKFQHCYKQCPRLRTNVLLTGAIGSGKTTLLKQFLRDHCCNVFYIEIAQCLKQYPGETEAELRRIFNAACDFQSKFRSDDPTVVIIDEISLFCPQITKSGDNTNIVRISAQLLSLVDELHLLGSNILCVATTSRPDNVNELARRPGRFENEISIAPLQEEHRYIILKEFLIQSISNFEPATHVLDIMAKQTQGYVIADMALLVHKITQIMSSQQQENFEIVAVNTLKKTNPISLKGSDVTAYRTKETFDMIGLKQHKAFKRFGLSLPKGVLLYGPPGCAKTTIAKCLATEANMTFIATSGAEVYSPYIGCAEKFIAKIFQTARKNAPCLIFLDEIDSLVGRRTLTSSSSSGDVQVRILSTLLTEMDGVVSSSSADNNNHILVVAATNRPDMLDDALMRPGRFDKLIHVPAPDFLSRRSILALCKQRMPFGECVDLDNIARKTENFSGADICNLCNEAAMHAFQSDFNCDEIKMLDFETILKITKSSLQQSQIEWYYEFENKFIK